MIDARVVVQELRRRKLGHWTVAYVAGAWVFLQALQLLGDSFDWPRAVLRVAVILLAVGLLAVLVVAWYHGEKGAQRVSGMEILMLAGILVLAGAAVAFVSLGRRRATPPTTAAGAPVASIASEASIAVLPFLDMSPKRDQDYFSDGLTEELLNVLAKVPALRVAARTSSFAFKGKEVEVDSIGRALHVAHVLEGSVRTEGQRVRITAQLIDARSGYHLWSESYDRDLKDVFALQGEISKAIVDQLRVKLGAGEAQTASSAGTVNPQAHALVLRGTQISRNGTRESLAQARELLTEAIRLDPRYARAHAELGSVYAQQAYMRTAPLEESYRLARDEARQALTLDPCDFSAHEVLGRIADYHDWDFRAAEEQYRRAIECNPSDARSHSHRAWLLMRLRRTDEALAEAKRAVELDPLSPGMLSNLAAMYLYAGQQGKDVETMLLADALEPNQPFTLANLASAYATAGRGAEAVRAIERALPLAPEDPFTLATAAYAYAAVGRRAESEKLLRRMEGIRDVSPYLLAEVHLALGDRDRAFQLLEKAVAARDDYAGDLGVDPVFKPLRSDPRFQALLRKGGLQ